MSVSELERFCGVVLEPSTLDLTGKAVKDCWIWRCFSKLVVALGEITSPPSDTRSCVEHVLEGLERLIGASLTTLNIDRLIVGSWKENLLLVNAFLGLFQVVRAKQVQLGTRICTPRTRRSRVTKGKSPLPPKRPGAGLYFPDKATSVKYSPRTQKKKEQSRQLRVLGRVVRSPRLVKQQGKPSLIALEEVTETVKNQQDKIIAKAVADQHAKHESYVSDLVEAMRQQVSAADAVFRYDLRSTPLRKRNEQLAARTARLSEQARVHERKRQDVIKKNLISGVRRKAVADGLRKDDLAFLAERSRLRDKVKQRAEFLRDLHAESKRQKTENFASLSQKVQRALRERRTDQEIAKGQIQSMETEERQLLKEQREVYAKRMRELNVEAAKMLADLL